MDSVSTTSRPSGSPAQQFQNAAADDPMIAGLLTARNIIVVTGAGMSAPSGMPTFRGEGGLYETAVEEPPIHREDIKNRPEAFVAWRKTMHEASLATEPNEGHHALTQCQADLKAAGGSMLLVTMNVDDLHDRTGAEVHHIHGRVDEERCDECWVTRPAIHEMTPCECGSFFRTGVVVYGEALVKTAATALHDAVRSEPDAFYVIGSSGATGNLWAATVDSRRRGIPTVLIALNPDPDFATEFDIVIDDSAVNVANYLPQPQGASV